MNAVGKALTALGVVVDTIIVHACASDNGGVDETEYIYTLLKTSSGRTHCSGRASRACVSEKDG